MKWDVFTVLEQVLILLTISSQIWIAINVIMKSQGAEQYVRIMSFSFDILVIGSVFPFLVGVLISEGTIFALRLGMPVPIRMLLMVAAFTLSQAAYTNYIALASQVTTLDKAFIPNLSYAIAVGLWLTFRYRDMEPTADAAEKGK